MRKGIKLIKKEAEHDLVSRKFGQLGPKKSRFPYKTFFNIDPHALEQVFPLQNGPFPASFPLFSSFQYS